jgi:hypothetical protein
LTIQLLPSATFTWAWHLGCQHGFQEILLINGADEAGGWS